MIPVLFKEKRDLINGIKLNLEGSFTVIRREKLLLGLSSACKVSSLKQQ